MPDRIHRTAIDQSTGARKAFRGHTLLDDHALGLQVRKAHLWSAMTRADRARDYATADKLNDEYLAAVEESGRQRQTLGRAA